MPLEVPVDVDFFGEPFRASCVNLGLGGLFVATERRFEIGSRCSLRFALPGQAEPIAVAAEVQWLYGHQGRALGMGLRFVDVPPVAAVAIQAFLRQFDDGLVV